MTLSLPVLDDRSAAVLNLRELHDALASAISTHDVRSDRGSRALYATDASVYQIVPFMVAFPATAADVAEVVRICSRFQVPITARGGGTSQAGQSIGAGVILDCSRHFNHVIEIDTHERWARVEPGCVLEELNQTLRPLGLLFAPDISTANRATIGGMIANNASGARSVLYGKTIDHVLELKVVLADGSEIHTRSLDEAQFQAIAAQSDLEGACYRATRRLAEKHADEIHRRFPRILRRVGGYNLDAFVPRPNASEGTFDFNFTRLLVGSEGTLGITVEAKLKLVGLPGARVTLVVEFADLLEALAATPLILEHQPAAVEVIDQYVLDSTKLNPEANRLRDFLQGNPAAILLIELYADRVDLLPSRLARLEAALRERGFGYHHLAVTDTAAQAKVWRLRTMALGLSMAEKGDAKAISFVEDTAVSPDHLRDYIAEFLAIIARHGTRAGIYAHASVGCLHVRPVINLKTGDGVRQFEAIAQDVAELVLKYGGSLSGEHGDGLVRSPFQEKMYGPALYQAFRELKHQFDPANILNPGKIVDAPPLVANLRYGPTYVTPDVPTTFDFSADGGLLPATELCAGVGACRKKAEGTMCPSFKRRAMKKTALAAELTCSEWRLPGSSASPASQTRTFITSSTCALNVRPARASARPTSTWLGSRPSSWISITGDMACPGGAGCLATLTPWGGSAAPPRRYRRGFCKVRRPGGSRTSCWQLTAAGFHRHLHNARYANGSRAFISEHLPYRQSVTRCCCFPIRLQISSSPM